MSGTETADSRTNKNPTQTVSYFKERAGSQTPFVNDYTMIPYVYAKPGTTPGRSRRDREDAAIMENTRMIRAYGSPSRNKESVTTISPKKKVNLLNQQSHKRPSILIDRKTIQEKKEHIDKLTNYYRGSSLFEIKKFGEPLSHASMTQPNFKKGQEI